MASLRGVELERKKTNSFAHPNDKNAYGGSIR
jgi:hypothetical protein